MVKNKKKLIIAVAIVGLLIILLIAVRSYIPPLKAYTKYFDCSIDGVKIDILDYAHDTAFRDSWSFYRVRVNGDPSGTIFDLSYME